IHSRCGRPRINIYLSLDKDAYLTGLKTLAGLPATIVQLGTSLVTTAPAPTIAYSPIVTPARMVALEPMDAPFLTRVGTTFQSSSVCVLPPIVVERGYRSFMKVTLCPMKTSSSMRTPSQINV